MDQNRGTREKQSARLWNVAIYIRLSREDARHLAESESISNQRAIIRDHIARFDDGDVYRIVREYVDDGVSGTTDDDRAGFQEMVRDIRAGLINCVIVKDLARSFRNYSDQGYYLDDWFPRHNVRFISLFHQPLDTYRDQYPMGNIMIPIQGVLNENHCAETSAKVREVFDMKRRKGEYIGGFGVYGYRKDPHNKNALVVDPEAAAVVKDIFQSYLGGMSKSGIVQELNGRGVLCPSRYKRERLGLNYCNPNVAEGGQTLWSVSTITEILKNRFYCGDMVQGRQRTKSYKIHVQERVPQEAWFIVENTHEPIIDRQTFEQVQLLSARHTRTGPHKAHVYLFSGFLRCGDCQKAMGRSAVKNHVYYFCTTYKNQSRLACSRHALRHDQLVQAVLYAVQQQIYAALDHEKTIRALEQAPPVTDPAKKLQALLQQNEAEINKVLWYKRESYQDWKDGELTSADYQELRTQYEKQLEQLRAIRETLQQDLTNAEQHTGVEAPLLKAFRKYQNITELTRELLVALVEQIEVYEDKKIKILFRFADPFGPTAAPMGTEAKAQTVKNPAPHSEVMKV